jgi:UDP-N-acetyl-D-mannosaminuronic acid dehydrogenase
MNDVDVCVIGLGYIGLPTAAIFASSGHRVLGVEINEELLGFVKDKGAPPEEPGLAELVLKVLKSGELILARSPSPSNVFVLCLPTPIKKDKSPDLSYLKNGVESILRVLKKGDMVVIESTVPPGTTRGIVANMLMETGLDPHDDVDLAFAPERVIPGNILKEIQGLDRVIGGLTPGAAARAGELYGSFVRGKILLTDATTAEFVKLVENSYRDVNIAFANELARLAPELEIDIWEAIDIANRHPRVSIHKPGPGVGGHCIAVDPYFIIDSVGEQRARLLSLAREVNATMPLEVVKRLEEGVGKLDGRKFAILGIAYKGNVGDPRESPALQVIRIIEKRGGLCAAHDPFVRDSPVPLMSLTEAVTDADALLVITNHDMFGDIDPVAVGRAVSRKLILDTRNTIDRTRWRDAGWEVLILGNGKPVV